MRVIPKIEDSRIVLVFGNYSDRKSWFELWDGAHHEVSGDYIKSLPNATDKEEIHNMLQKYNDSLPYWEKVTDWEIVAE